MNAKLHWKRLLLLVVGLAALAALVLLLRPGAPAQGPQLPGAEPWTILLYMVDADPAVPGSMAQRDWAEITAALRPDTQLLALVGPAAPGECGLYRLGGEEPALLESFSGGLGDPAVLEKLLGAGAEISRGPAALILWDHGYGPLEGFGGAGDSPAEERLTLPEIAAALSRCGMKERPLTVIGFDACLMASCETALPLAPYAEYLIASQETEPADGWDYGFLAEVGPETGGEEFGRLAISRFAEYYDRQYASFPQYWQPCTLSLIRLAGIPALAERIGEYFRALDRDMQAGGFSDIARMRLDTWGFGRGTTATEYDVIDLEELARAGEGSHPEARRVLSALEDCLVFRAGSEQRANGLSVYFPQLAVASQMWQWQDGVRALSVPDSWQGFLRRYVTQLSAEQGDEGEAELEDWDESAVRLRLSDGAAGNFAYAKYYLLEGTLEEGMVLRCARRSGQLEGTLLTVPYQRTVMRLSNGQTSCPTVAFPVQADDGGEYYRSHVLAMMKEPLFSSKSVYLRSVRDKQSGAWRVLTAFETGTALETGRQEIRLEEIDELLLYYNALLPTYSQSGRLLPWHGWRASALSSNDCLSMTDTCTLLEAPLEEEDGGPYWLQIIIVNADNRQYSAALLPL